MNRKSKIIASVTGIFLVLLILVGLTYAYFLTRINGNTNTKSISVTTANLVLDYGEDSAEIIGEKKLIPGNVAATKTFEATNKGNSEVDYVTTLENIDYKIGDDSTITSFIRQQDLVYTITCKQYKVIYNGAGIETGETEDGTCEGLTEALFPVETGVSIPNTPGKTDGANNVGVMVGNKIKAGYRHKYTLTVTYKEAGVNQSDDMNKTFEAKVNIRDIRLINPYSSNTSSLAYNIINNSISGTNGTKLMGAPLSKPAEEISKSWKSGKKELREVDSSLMYYGYSAWVVADEEHLDNIADEGSEVSSCADILSKGGYVYDRSGVITEILHVVDCSENDLPITEMEKIEFESSLNVTPDDYGTSYYYRGNVEDNYVTFAGMCWRIVRIDGSGNTKLLLEDQDEVCSPSMNGNWNIEASNGTTITTQRRGRTDTVIRTGNFGVYDNVNAMAIDSYLNPNLNTEYSMSNAFKYFQMNTLTNKISNVYSGKSINDYLARGNWCMNDKAYLNSNDNSTPLTSAEISMHQADDFYYDSYVRLSTMNGIPVQPLLKCNGTIMNKFGDNTDMYVGTITADEAVYAGGKLNESNNYFYLINDYQKEMHVAFWTLSPARHSFDTNYALGVEYMNYLSDSEEFGFGGLALRPSINLKSGINATGNGTIKSPYVIQ